MYERSNPKCERAECFGCQEGECIILVKNDFKKPCPFFKTWEQVAQEKAYRRERLAELQKK